MNKFQPDVGADPVRLARGLIHGGKLAETAIDAAMAKIGLSNVKWYALSTLAEAGGSLPLGHLADQLACAKSNITQLVDRLVAEQLVQRVPDDHDRRSISATLTATGYQRYEAGRQVMDEFARGLLADVGPAERHLLETVLQRLAMRA